LTSKEIVENTSTFILKSHWDIVTGV
jgi:hypothetical protein